MKILFKISILISVVWLAFACTDGFEDINTNPNRTTEVDPQALFMGSPINTMMTFGSTNNFWVFGNYSGQISMAGGVYPNYGSDGREGNMWNDLYIKCLNPLAKVQEVFTSKADASGKLTYSAADSASNSNKLAIAKIWKSYIYSEMVALWGPVPYFNACKGKEYTPYDSESAIYKDLLNELKKNANVLNKDGDKFNDKKDPVFNSNIDKWKKFAHSIRLRVASRLVDFADDEVRALGRAALLEELNAPENLISGNAENAYMNFAAERTYWNPFFVYTKIDNVNAEGTFPVIHEQFLMYLIGYDDPRLNIFCKKVTYKYATGNWQYRGRPSTTRVPDGLQILDNPHASAKQNYYSYITDEFAGQYAKWMIISYPEIACIRAETAYRGDIGWGQEGMAKDYYNASIDAFKDRYETAISPEALETYKNHWGIKWKEAGDPVYDFSGDTIPKRDNRVSAKKAVSLYTDYLGIANCVLSDKAVDNPLTVNVEANGINKSVTYNYATDANYKRIVLQHWMALFFQGIDAWTLLRRTQQLQFTPVWYPSSDTYTSYTLHHAYLPQRLPYPASEIRASSAESGKAIEMLDNALLSNSGQVLLKFAKPVRPFIPEYPYAVQYLK